MLVPLTYKESARQMKRNFIHLFVHEYTYQLKVCVSLNFH